MSEHRCAEPGDQPNPAHPSGPDAVAITARAAKEEADRISFSDLGRRRDELTRSLPENGELAAALAEDETYQALLERRDALRRRQAELDELAERARVLAGTMPDRSDPGGSERVSGPDVLVPRLRPLEEAAAGVGRSRGRGASGWVQHALRFLVGLAATAGLAAVVYEEARVGGSSQDSAPPAPKPDHETCTGVWLHPVLFDALKGRDHRQLLGNANRLGDFLAERRLSLSERPPLVRIEFASSFDDPDLQARFGLKYSYAAGPDQVVDVLSSLCDAKDRSSCVPGLGVVPLHRMDLANLPEPMDAAAILNRGSRRQAFGRPRLDRSVGLGEDPRIRRTRSVGVSHAGAMPSGSKSDAATGPRT